MAKDFNTYMAESGQQSTLDSLRASGGYDAARASYEGGGSYGGGGGRTAESIDLSSVPSVLEYAKSMGVGEENLMNYIVNYMRSQEKPLDIYSRLETEAGLPELRKTSTSLSKEIAGIEDYLDQIEPDVSARTRESMVTEAQRRGMVAAGKEPYQQKLTKLGTALGRVQGGISEATQGIATKTGLALQGQEMELEPLKMQYTALVDRNARLMTGFTIDRQTQLDVLFDKLNRQRELDDQEWALANTLAQEERAYARTLETTAASAGVKLNGGESIETLLNLIGTTAAEEIQYNRNKTGKGTETERKQATALVSLRNDVKNGATFQDVVTRYGDTIPAYQIREEYNSTSRYGQAKESETDVYNWLNPITPTEQANLKTKGSFDQATYDFYIQQGFSEATARLLATS